MKNEKDKKDKQINVRVNEFQLELLQKLVLDGKAKSQSGALIYLINQYGITGK
ncbi:hypothetical protein ABJ736_000874 [Escherichia coli]|uniref:hypothetical protein n=1 Tax=Enterobacter hormaechei TaxID=158836 RepID=UPI0018CE5AD2|nr:hypothetical protein [Enterobacter hormaechei]